MNISINNDYCEKDQKDEVKNKEIPTSVSNTGVVKMENLNEEEILSVESKEYLSNSSSNQDMASVSYKQNTINLFNEFNPKKLICY